MSGEDTSLAKAKEAVDWIVRQIETRFKGFNISEIIKAGSLGQGTAVPGHYNIDLVIYSRDISGQEVYDSNGFEQWIIQLRSFVEKQLGIRCKARGYNHRSVQFVVDRNGLPLEVDLLVSPYWNSPDEFYRFLGTVQKKQRKMFTVCASKWQVEFFKRREKQDLKEYVRRAKAWRNREWEGDDTGKPSSYLMSLLVVKAYQSGVQGAAGITRALKTLVKNYRTMDVYWADKPGSFYKRADHKYLLPSRPRLIDPANPANDVWETGFSGTCLILVNKIDSIDLS